MKKPEINLPFAKIFLKYKYNNMLYLYIFTLLFHASCRFSEIGLINQEKEALKGSLCYLTRTFTLSKDST